MKRGTAPLGEREEELLRQLAAHQLIVRYFAHLQTWYDGSRISKSRKLFFLLNNSFFQVGRREFVARLVFQDSQLLKSLPCVHNV